MQEIERRGFLGALGGLFALPKLPPKSVLEPTTIPLRASRLRIPGVLRPSIKSKIRKYLQPGLADPGVIYFDPSGFNIS